MSLDPDGDTCREAVYQRPTVDVIARALETAGFQSIDENGAAAEKATTEEEVITENSQNMAVIARADDG